MLDLLFLWMEIRVAFLNTLFPTGKKREQSRLIE